jgi:hypothetical protein
VRLIRGSANIAFKGGFAAARIGLACVGEKSASSTPTVTYSAQLCDTLKGVRPHDPASAVPPGTSAALNVYDIIWNIASVAGGQANAGRRSSPWFGTATGAAPVHALLWE